MDNYIRTTSRLGLREWSDSDVAPMSLINKDTEVMKYFPSTYNEDQTAGFVQRMIESYKERGYCYFATDELSTGNFIGFIGIAYQTYEADFTPCIDIGWRLGKQYWGNGYATEGAKACLVYAHNRLNIKEIKSIASQSNIPSINVMKKIGMQFKYTFDHPLLLKSKDLKKCVLYSSTVK